MKRRHQFIGLTTLGLLVTFIVPALSERGAWNREEEPEIISSLRVPPTQAMVARLAMVKIEDAIAAARGAASGMVIGAELENEDGGLVWSIDVAGDTQVLEVIIDAGNKRVLAVEAEEEDDDEDDDEDDGEDEDEDEDDEGDGKECGRRPWGRCR